MQQKLQSSFMEIYPLWQSLWNIDDLHMKKKHVVYKKTKIKR